MSADRWGIEDRYEDALGVQRSTSEETRQAIRQTMGLDEFSDFSRAHLEVLLPGRQSSLHGPGELILEDGAALRVEAALPHDLPLGYHDFQPADGSPATRLIVSPGRCLLPPGLHTWGWAAQLYAARSRGSWGLGDLADLRELARWSAGLGAGILLINPLHAVAPTLPQEASPYFPSSRRFRNPLYLRIEDVPGFASLAGELSELAAAGRALNGDRLIQRDEVFRLKLAALEKIWSRRQPNDAFDQYCAQQGDSLRQWATYCVLAETFGRSWRSWPAEYRTTAAPGIAPFVKQHAERLQFFRWLQWLLDEQLARAGAELPLMQDLPVGADPDGADAWAWQDVLADGARIGAPPDVFNTRGQDWGLPPFVPHKLRAARYQPFIETIRSTLRHAGGLRIDHALGLFRLFWIPRGMQARDGAYVRYASEELLAIIALESHRAGAFIVAEDLGTVEPGVRQQLADHDILSYRLLWFESRPPGDYPQKALAAITTHDLPTVAGLWSGSDLKDQQRLNLKPSVESVNAVREQLISIAGLAPGDPLATAVQKAYSALGQAPSAVITATLDDLLTVEERPNMPSTIDQWPNWRLALPEPLEVLEDLPLAKSVAQYLSRRQPKTAKRAASEALKP